MAHAKKASFIKGAWHITNRRTPSDMPSQVKRRRREGGASDSDASGEHTRTDAEAEDEVLRDALLETVNASVEAARRRAGEERTKLLADAQEDAAAVTAAAEEKAAKVTEAAMGKQSEVEEMKRVVEDDRRALEAEKARMEKAHAFQKSKLLLDVGGHNFTTSRQTLTSVPDTYFASLFSGRFELTPDENNGAYFIDRDGRHFHHILNFLRDPVHFTVSADLTVEHCTSWNTVDTQLASASRVSTLAPSAWFQPLRL
jgi:hypothetical protein